MKPFIILIFTIFCHSTAFSQRFGWAGNCNVNVNDPSYLNHIAGRQGIISASVKISVGTTCSGILINRNVPDSEVGFYILTAKHCIDETNFNTPHLIYFNYQSVGTNNESTHPSNRGEVFGHQSTSLEDNGYQYCHRSRLRLVADFTWGDLALVEILTPVPPHFNVTFAGWIPYRLHDIDLPPVNPTPFAGIHHPRGDIKKISGINKVRWGENPTATGCYIVTTTIDVLFGWIWGNRKSTKVVCNYVDNPYVVVPWFQYGVVELASSGSGIFNQDNRLFGVLTGGASSCGFPVLEHYGKLSANYYKASIKNVLNPSNNVWVDHLGIGERKITQYENLILPGANGVSGQYFPANHYQADNKIVLRASNNITTTQPLTIFNGADYELIAGNQIILGDGFIAQEGSKFSAKIATGSGSRVAASTIEDELIDKLKSIELPRHREFISEKYVQKHDVKEEITISDVYPNPNNGNFSIDIKAYGRESSFYIEILNQQGQAVYQNSVVVDDFATVPHNRNNLSRGFYILRISDNHVVVNKKLIVE